MLANKVAEINHHGRSPAAARITHWERGENEPSPSYRDDLGRIYQCSLVELGLAADYSAEPSEHPATQHEDGHPAPFVRQALDGHEQPDFMDALDLVPATGMVRIVQLRHRVGETLAGSSLSDATVEHKETMAITHGRTYKTMPVNEFLSSALAELQEVQAMTDRRLPSSQRRDLCAVMARLAGLVSMSMVNVGHCREAREWAHTARLAADEAGDPTLRAWVATRSAVAALHFGDPRSAATAAREAEVLSRSHPSPITAMAWAILARAAGTMGDLTTAQQSITRAKAVFFDTAGQLNDQDSNSAYTFTAAQLHFYIANALTGFGDTEAAWRAQEDALAAFGPYERLDPALLHLDRAQCMVRDGDVTGGASYAARQLLNLSHEYRPAIVYKRGIAVAEAVPPQQRKLSAVRELHEVLNLRPAAALTIVW